MQNGSYGEKEKSIEGKAKDTIVETERDKLSRSVLTRGDQDFWEARMGYLMSGTKRRKC